MKLTILLILITSVHTFAIKPDSTYHVEPSEYGINYNEIQLITKDSFTLNLWVYNPENLDSNTQTLIVVGSDAGNMSHLISYAANFAQMGFRVVTFDYRGFGRSSRKAFTSNQYYCQGFEKDLITVVNHFFNLYEKRVNILAFSLGTLVTQNSFDNIDTKVNNLVCDGLVVNPNMVIKRVNKIKNKKIKRIKFKKENSKIPASIRILVFGGSADKLTTINDIEEFREINKSSIVISHPGGHMESDRYLGIIYYQLIYYFIIQR